MNVLITKIGLTSGKYFQIYGLSLNMFKFININHDK